MRLKYVSENCIFRTSPIFEFSHSLDPTETWAAPDFRSAKALFVPSLKGDIVPLIA